MTNATTEANMNTVLLAADTGPKEPPRWWAQALRGVHPDSRPRAAALLTSPRDDAGAQRLATRLRAILDDNWTLICGYCNSGGRLDHILVGPRGVMALACTALHGRMHCDGERWRRDKFDLYNNLVERDAPIPQDPAGDLYRATARLQQVLTGQTSIRRVATALVFTHHAATLGHIRHGVLDMVTLLSDLKTATLLQAMSGHPDHRTIDGVVEVIRHEHARFMRHVGQKGGRRQALFLER
jgi:hypothetical protein